MPVEGRTTLEGAALAVHPRRSLSSDERIRVRLDLPLFTFLAALTVCPAAQANTLEDSFTLSWGDQTLTFVSPASPTPVNYLAGTYFSISPAATITPPLAGGSFASESLNFFTAAETGGFADEYFGIDAQDGVVLFSGDVTDPTFIPGTYDFTAANDGTGVLTITPTPEPASFALLVTGILCVTGFAFRRGKAVSHA
jgi:hypothetical protein